MERSSLMGKNTVRKLTPFVDTDIFAAESWLSDMAAKGLFFKDSSVWQHVIFEKGEPTKRKYRLVPAGFVELSMISEEEKEIYSSAGWHYAGVFQQCGSRVFYTDDVNAEEIYTDSEGLDFFYKKQRIKVLQPAIVAAVLLGAWVYGYTGTDMSLMPGSFAAGMICLLAAGLLLAAYAVLSAANVVSLRKKLRSGQIKHDVRYGWRLIIGRTIVITLILTMIFKWLAPVIEGIILAWQ